MVDTTSPIGSSLAADRPTQPVAAEVEIMPAMIEAGLEVLHASGAIEHPLQADRLLVEEVFRVMLAASRT